jgi:hypothetical protein
MLIGGVHVANGKNLFLSGERVLCWDDLLRCWDGLLSYDVCRGQAGHSGEERST